MVYISEIYYSFYHQIVTVYGHHSHHRHHRTGTKSGQLVKEGFCLITMTEHYCWKLPFYTIVNANKLTLKLLGPNQNKLRENKDVIIQRLILIKYSKVDIDQIFKGWHLSNIQRLILIKYSIQSISILNNIIESWLWKAC